MSGNDEAENSKPPLSLDDAERLASQFTPLWEDVPEAEQAAAEPSEVAIAVAEQPVVAPVAPGEPPGAPEVASPASEPTPAMVAIAAPMGSSPDIDPNSTELPVRRSDYAPPRPLAVSHRTMVGLAPPPAVQVAPSATTTPLGLSGPPAAKPSLHVVAETSALGMEAAPARDDDRARARIAANAATRIIAVPRVSRAQPSEPEFELPAPRKRATGIVIGVMSVAALLVGAGAIRAVFFKDDDSVKGTVAHSAETAPAARAVVPAATATPGAGVAPEGVRGGSEVTSAAAAATAPLAATEAPPAAATGEIAAPAAAPSAAPVQLAATRETPPPTKQEGTKARTAQRVVEEAKRPTRPARAPQPARRAHTEGATHAPASPQLPGGGAIVRQTPF